MTTVGYEYEIVSKKKTTSYSSTNELTTTSTYYENYTRTTNIRTYS